MREQLHDPEEIKILIDVKESHTKDQTLFLSFLIKDLSEHINYINLHTHT